MYQRKNGCSALACFSIQARAPRSDLLVDGFHALLGQRAGVRDRLPALAVGQAVEHAARSELLLEFRILGIVRQFRFFLGVEVIEIAEEFVEPVHGRQIFVAIAQMVLAELAGGVAERLQHFGDGRVFRVKSDRRAGHADFGQAGADRVLTGDEARAAGGAALLAVPIGEGRPFLRDAVDVWGLVAHHAFAVMADVPIADIVSPNDEDIWLVRLRHADAPLVDVPVLNRAFSRCPLRLRRYTRRNSTAKKANIPMRARTIATASSGVCFPSRVTPAITAKSPLHR